MVRKVTKYQIISLYLNDYSKRYYLRELAFLLKKPHQTIKPYVKELVKEKILIQNKRRKITDYNLNFKNKKIYNYLVICEKQKLMEKLEQDALLNILYEKISLFFKNNTFVIFGSATDNTKKAEDIDLLIIGQKNILGIEDFERTYRRIHKIQVSNINKLTLTLIKEIYKKHLILNNTEKIIQFFGELYEKNRLV